MRSLLLIPALLTSGCVFGQVRSASNSAPIAGATVWTIGSCSGTKCVSPYDGIAQTDNSGAYEFNPYDDQAMTRVMPGSREAMLMLFMKNGYRTVSHFFTPELVEMENEEGQKYSQVPDQFLAPYAQSADTDMDGLPNLEELIHGTDPNDPDTDGDHLSDYVEVHGGNYVDLPSLGADPLVPDIFVEMDWVPYITTTGVAMDGPFPEAVEDVVAAFAAQGINLHLFVDNEIPDPNNEHDYLCDGNDPWGEVSTIKAANFNPDRQPFFHYAVFSGNYCSGGSLTDSSGLSPTSPNVDFVVTLKSKIPAEPNPASYPGGTFNINYINDYFAFRQTARIQQAGTIMHELGHNLGLRHNGSSSIVENNIAYLSVMSYRYQLGGLRRDNVSVVDYSNFPIVFNENSLNEQLGLDAGPNAAYAAELARYTLRYADDEVTKLPVWQDDWAAYCAPNAVGTSAASIVDWNQDCAISVNPVAVDMTREGAIIDISTWRDWSNLDYSGDGVIGVSYAPAGDRPGAFAAAPAREGRPETMADEWIGAAAGSGQTIRRREAPEGFSRQEWDAVLDQLPPGQRQWLEYTADRPREIAGPGTDCQ